MTPPHHDREFLLIAGRDDFQVRRALMVSPPLSDRCLELREIRTVADPHPALDLDQVRPHHDRAHARGETGRCLARGERTDRHIGSDAGQRDEANLLGGVVDVDRSWGIKGQHRAHRQSNHRAAGNLDRAVSQECGRHRGWLEPRRLLRKRAGRESPRAAGSDRDSRHWCWQAG